MSELVWQMGRRLWRRFKKREPVYLSPVRRISRVALPTGERLVAMTFDDGPTAAPPNPPGSASGLTEAILALLGKYGARGTFDVIGSTVENYPDRAGRTGTPLWSGRRFDHYPAFGRDREAGVANQPELARRLVQAGHELANHGYRHLALGPSRLVYGTRAHWPDFPSALDDLKRLHELVRSATSVSMALARPPHYVDRLPDGLTAYHLYLAMGYQYLAASWDGGGWRPSSGDYRRDVAAMVVPLARALQGDAGCLSGQIIFHKDGYNMSEQSPVVDALERHLDLLTDHGYRVVTVSELLSISPLADFGAGSHIGSGTRGGADSPGGAGNPGAADSACLEGGWSLVKRLLQEGYCLAYRDNTFRPWQPLTRGEMLVMFLPPSAWMPRACDLSAWRERVRRRGPGRFDDVPEHHPYWTWVESACELGLLERTSGHLGVNDPVAPAELERTIRRLAQTGLLPRTASARAAGPISNLADDRSVGRLAAIVTLATSA